MHWQRESVSLTQVGQVDAHHSTPLSRRGRILPLVIDTDASTDETAAETLRLDTWILMTIRTKMA